MILRLAQERLKERKKRFDAPCHKVSRKNQRQQKQKKEPAYQRAGKEKRRMTTNDHLQHSRTPKAVRLASWQV